MAGYIQNLDKTGPSWVKPDQTGSNQGKIQEIVCKIWEMLRE